MSVEPTELRLIGQVAFDRSFDRINLGQKIQIEHIDTESQLAEILIEGKFARDEWIHFLFVQHLPIQFNQSRRGR